MSEKIEPMTEAEVERFRANNEGTVFPDHGYRRLLATLDAARKREEGYRAALEKIAEICDHPYGPYCNTCGISIFEDGSCGNDECYGQIARAALRGASA